MDRPVIYGMHVWLIVKIWGKGLFFDVFGDNWKSVARGKLHSILIRAYDANTHIRVTALGIVVFNLIIFVVVLFERLGPRGIHRAVGRRGDSRRRKILPAKYPKRDQVSACLEILFTNDPDEASVLGNLYFWMVGIGEYMGLVRIRCRGEKAILSVIVAL